MASFIHRVRQPVKRAGADRYLLITLLSFAASVVLTRLFLELSGYPRVGGGDLHIAHVLWGGLLLFIASLLPLLLANRWVYTVGAVLSGIGVGLFIDEVGKFITTSNDYFYPAAAPIIYAFFLLTVLLYLRMHKPPSLDPRSALYHALDLVTEVLDYDLEPHELTELKVSLRRAAAQKKEPDLAKLAEELLHFLSSDAVRLLPDAPTVLEELEDRGRDFERHHLGRRRLKTVLIAGFGLLGLPPLLALGPLLSMAVAPPDVQKDVAMVLAATGQLTAGRQLELLLIRLGLGALAGLPLLVAGGYLLAGKDRVGIMVGHFGLLISLAVVNLLVFYVDQFQTMGVALIQFALLLGTIHYRRHYLGSQG